MGAELATSRSDQRPGARSWTTMAHENFSKDICFEAPPVVEENFDLDTPDEQSSCENCIFYDSIMCEICILQDKWKYQPDY